MTAVVEHKLLTYKFGWKGFDFAQIERDLVELGLEGWEAVGSLSPTLGNGHTNQLAVILKRTPARG